MLEKIKSVFVIGAALLAKKLGRCLKKLQELKKYPWKTCSYGQPIGHLIRDLNERSVKDGGKSSVVGDSQISSI